MDRPASPQEYRCHRLACMAALSQEYGIAKIRRKRQSQSQRGCHGADVSLIDIVHSNPNFRPSLATNTMTKESFGSRRFAIALSFPGEHRPFVQEVAGHLAAAFGRDRVLYDKFHEAEFTRVGLDVDLPNLYNSSRCFFIPISSGPPSEAIGIAPTAPGLAGDVRFGQRLAIPVVARGARVVVGGSRH
jgi:hypothetical protein